MVRFFIEYRFVSNFSPDREHARRFYRAWQFAREQPASQSEPFGQFLRRMGIRAEGRGVVIFEIVKEALAGEEPVGCNRDTTVANEDNR